MVTDPLFGQDGTGGNPAGALPAFELPPLPVPDLPELRRPRLVADLAQERGLLPDAPRPPDAAAEPSGATTHPSDRGAADPRDGDPGVAAGGAGDRDLRAPADSGGGAAAGPSTGRDVGAAPGDAMIDASGATTSRGAVPRPEPLITAPAPGRTPGPRPPGPPVALPVTAARPRIEPEPAILGLSRHSRSRLGSLLFTWFFVGIFTLILVQMVWSLLTY